MGRDRNHRVTTMVCYRCGCRLRVEDLVPGARGLRCKSVATCSWRRQRALDARQLTFDFKVVK